MLKLCNCVRDAHAEVLFAKTKSKNLAKFKFCRQEGFEERTIMLVLQRSFNRSTWHR